MLRFASRSKCNSAADIEIPESAPVRPASVPTRKELGGWARRVWLPALKRAGLEKRFHVHELRHYAATALDGQGMKGKLRTEIVGHANEEITNSIYTHVRRERVAAVAADYDPLGTAEAGRSR